MENWIVGLSFDMRKRKKEMVAIRDVKAVDFHAASTASASASASILQLEY